MNKNTMESFVHTLINNNEIDSIWQASMKLNNDDFEMLEKRLNDMIDLLNDAKVTRQNMLFLTQRNQSEKQTLAVQDVPTTRQHTMMACEDHDPPLPAEVLRQLALSRFLTSEELGRLLLLTSKALSRSLSKDFIWRNICDTRWRSTPPKALISSKGYHWYFRQLSKTSQQSHERRGEEIPSPRLRSENLVLIINIRNPQQGKFVSATLQGERLDALLLSKGEIRIPFDTPVDLGELSLIPSSKGPGQFFFRDCSVRSCFGSWMTTVHLFRLDTNVCCCIHETSSFRYKGWCYNLASPNMVSVNIPAKGEIHLNMTGGGWGLTETGQDLKKRIQTLLPGAKEHANCLHLQLKILSTIRLMGDHDAKLEAHQLKVEIANFSDLDPRNLHGVTMLHVLNELSGWDRC
jgi:hypothetical protein